MRAIVEWDLFRSFFLSFLSHPGSCLKIQNFRVGGRGGGRLVVEGRGRERKEGVGGGFG